MKRCKTESIKGGKILGLSLHLIIDILSRLTIETILSCKCVCRTFLEILSDPHFVELHLTKAPNIDDGLIIQDRDTISDFLLIYNHRPEFYDSRPCQTLAMPTKASQFYNKLVYIVGSCNGLLCIRYLTEDYSGLIYYICNPILGEFLALPPLIKHKMAEHSGFGFCPNTKQYKVLRFVTPSICSIYTLGTKCWRQIGGGVPFPRTVASFDSSLNGNLHWITNSINMKYLICSFNLETEKFSYISPPADFNLDVFKKVIFLYLGLLGGLFCFSYNQNVTYEVYVMKDYGPEGCWTKKFSVDLSSSCFNLQGLSYGMIRLLNNGELVLQCGLYTLICCDLWKGTSRYMLAEKNVKCFCVLSFVPSLISLKDVAGVVGGNLEVVQRKMRRNLWSENGFKFIC